MEGTAKAMATLFTGAIVNDGGWQRSYFTRGDHIQTSHRKEVTLQVGSVLKIRGHPRDLVQVGSAYRYCQCLVSGDGDDGQR